jgi:hypothetical protein
MCVLCVLQLLASYMIPGQSFMDRTIYLVYFCYEFLTFTLCKKKLTFARVKSLIMCTFDLNKMTNSY